MTNDALLGFIPSTSNMICSCPKYLATLEAYIPYNPFEPIDLLHSRDILGDCVSTEMTFQKPESNTQARLSQGVSDNPMNGIENLLLIDNSIRGSSHSISKLAIFIPLQTRR
jgi:hypothetical protein